MITIFIFSKKKKGIANATVFSPLFMLYKQKEATYLNANHNVMSFKSV
jgi:hypothetical protein